MPYVAQSHREKLNPFINSLAEAIVAECIHEGTELTWPGLTNYAIFRTGLLVIRGLFGTSLRYMNMALYIGVLENVKQEFYERLGRPLEDEKKAANGDVDIVEDFLAW